MESIKAEQEQSLRPPSAYETPETELESNTRFSNTLSNFGRNALYATGLTAGITALSLAIADKTPSGDSTLSAGAVPGHLGAAPAEAAGPVVPEITLKQVLDGVDRAAKTYCSIKKELIYEAEKGGVGDHGKCQTYLVRQCHTGGPRGQKTYDLRRNEGKCWSRFFITYRNGEPTERNLYTKCTSPRVGIRLVKRFKPKDKNGNRATYWRPEYDFNKSEPWRCDPLKAI